MALHWVFGGSGYGKSRYVYDKIMKSSVDDPSGKYIVIVPEQFTMQTQRDMVMLSEAKSIMNIDVLSFVRLAYRVLEETAALDKPLLGDEGKGMIMRRILKEHASEWKTFGSNINRMGFVEEIKSIVTEFLQYRMDDNRLNGMLDGVRDRHVLAAKIQDLWLAYRYYKEYMEERYISSEELLSLLADYVPDSALIKGSVICIDGFTGFTPVQYVLLGELMKVCKDIYITVTVDRRADIFGKASPDELFYMSKTFVAKTMKTAVETGTEVLEPVWAGNGKKAWRFDGNRELAMLEERIFRDETKIRHSKTDAADVPYAGDNERVRVYEARNPYEETEYCVWKIRQLVRNEGLRYRDIAVITGDAENYSRMFGRLFDKCNIPYFADSNRSVPDNSFAGMILGILQVVKNDYDYQSVMSLLRNGIIRDYIGFGHEETDELDNYLTASGIRGYKAWRNPWRDNKKSRTDIELVNDTRSRVVDVFGELSEGLKDSRTVLDYCRSLYDFIAGWELDGVLLDIAGKYEEKGDYIKKKEYEQIYRIVINLIDQMTELLGDEEMSLKEFTELVKTGFSEASVGVIPPGVDTVIIGDITRTRLKDIKVLFFAGVNDGIVPGSIRQGGFLSDMERELLRENGAELAPTLRERIFNERFYIYLALTKPSDSLYISYSAKSCSAGELKPSSVLADINRLYDGNLRIESDYTGSGTDARIGNDFGKSAWIDGLRKYAEGSLDKEEETEWSSLHACIAKDADMDGIIDSAFYIRESFPLKGEIAGKLYGDEIEGSVSRLELYASCAYAHFLKYGLMLNERKEYNIGAPDIGTIFHRIIEEFGRRLEHVKKSWKDVDESIVSEWTKQITERVCNEFGYGIIISDARHEYMKKRIGRIARATITNLSEQMGRGNFRAESYEVMFNEEKVPDLFRVMLDDGRVMKLNGRIDRLDVCEEEDRVLYKIIDYKSGNEKFDMPKLYYGLTMQLIVYLDAANGIEKGRYPDKMVIPAGAFYYHIDDPVVDENPGDDDSDIRERIRKEFRMRGPVNGEDGIPVYIDSGLGTIGHGVEPGRESDVVDVKTGKDGGYMKSSKVYSGKQFEYMMRHVRNKIREFGNGITGGSIEASPYRLNKENSCMYCGFGAICGFDARLAGNEYRKFNDKDEEAIWKEWESLYGSKDGISAGTEESD